ncbi:hypothetical protein ACFPOI_25170 [Nonomuraea angiospora]|uniref:Uncharacterized protein n=1 Tax=Nonomuraea angiospora TaxID=46172 RepID=A0ABR9LQ56_9ACTN|nr:hypothetical protein [Nonomuraea angiospora]MBE1582555.1 hypothetical protein [Nonomuraea angiospora]
MTWYFGGMRRHKKALGRLPPQAHEPRPRRRHRRMREILATVDRLPLPDREGGSGG